jgi:N-acetylglucosamine malate deacetylase 1
VCGQFPRDFARIRPMSRLTGALQTWFGSSWRRHLTVAAVMVGSLVVILYQATVPSVEAQSTVLEYPDVLPPSAGQKVMVFSPHPDDETIALGGYIAEAETAGADLRLVLVTDGNKYHNQAVRYAEFRQATAILGVRPGGLVFLGFPDGRLSAENATALSASLKAQIDAFEPDIVVFPHPNDFNHDHAVIGRVLDGILSTRGKGTVAYEYLVHYKLVYPRPRKLAPDLYLSPPKLLTKSGDQWLAFHLSPRVEDLKKRAIFTYQSQMQSPELGGLMDSYVRRNELLVVSKP